MKISFKLISAILIIISSFVFASNKNSSDERSKPKESIKPVAGNIIYSGNFFKVQADSIQPDSSGIRSIGSVALCEEMIPGWNVGNSLEATGGETSWGNPKITKTLIDSVKAAGFNAVRIPVAWSSHFSNPDSFTIDPNWLDRVEEVVNYVLNNGMYAIINEHWDGGWQQPLYAMQDSVNNRLAVMWKQIALHFRDFDDHLLFAGTNEVMKEGDYSTPKTEYYTVQNSFNQTFVNTVRSTGGRNYYRYLLVQGFNTNIDYTVKFMKIPTDVIPNRLIVEVHYYDPYNFTINQNSSITQWGKNATNSKKTETWANESYVDNQFNKMKTTFVDKGYGVVIGEYGVLARLNLGSTEANDEFAGYRKYYMEYVTGSMFKHSVVPFYWDNGYTGNNGMGIFNRSTGEQVYPDIVNAIIEATDSSNINTKVGDINEIPNSFTLKQNYPNPFNPSTTIKYSVPDAGNANFAFPAMVTLKVYDVLGREIKTLVNEQKSAGNYITVFNGAGLASGIYFYRLTADNYSITKKMLMLK